jgi:hypothetical protein
MKSLLSLTYAKPLEREFESWIIEAIERYGKNIGRPPQVWAVSPSFEVVWPADEVVVIDGKVLGLQFKQAKMAPGLEDFSRLKWSLASPPQQYLNVQNSPEVYYCLPTFINRIFKREALHHCLFWRPPAAVADTQVWYDNPVATTAHNSLASDPTAMRWGRLLEQIQACIVGRRVQSSDEVATYLAEIAKSMQRNTQLEQSDEVYSDSTSPMYILYTPL